MNKKLMELLEKEIVTAEEFEFINEHEDIIKIENCGGSGKCVDKIWFNVVTIDGEEFNIYK